MSSRSFWRAGLAHENEIAHLHGSLHATQVADGAGVVGA
jgi:hypothetical protein